MMRSLPWRLILLVAALGVFGPGVSMLGCSGPDAEPSGVDGSSATSAESATTASSDLDAATAPTHVESAGFVPRPAQNPAQPAADSGRSQDRSGEIFRYHLTNARTLQSQGQLEEARSQVAAALRIRPNDPEATQLMVEISALLGDAGSAMHQEAIHAAAMSRARASEAHAQIQGYYDEARALYDSGNFNDALAMLDQARNIAHLQRGNASVASLVESIDALAHQCQIAREEASVEGYRETVEIGQQLQIQEQQNRVERNREEINRLYDQARNFFNSGDYEECLITLNQIIWRDPYNDDVIRMIELARQLKYQTRADNLRRRWIQEYQELEVEARDAQVPFIMEQYAANLPDMERWAQILRRREIVLRSQQTAEDPNTARIRDTLQQRYIPLRYTDADLGEVITDFRELSGLNFEYSRDVRDAIEGQDYDPIDVDISQIRLAHALDIVLDAAGGDELTYYIENGAIIISTTDEREGHGLLFRIFNVTDLLGGYRSFPGEEIRLTSDGEQEWAPPADDDMGLSLELGDILDMVQEAIAPDTWGDPALLEEGPNGTIVAINEAVILDEVAQLFDDLRQSRGLMVSIECRFIEIQDNFLEEIGIDYRGAGGVPPGAVGPNLTAAPLDDFQFGLNFTNLNAAYPIVGRDTSTGIYWSNAPDSEIRMRVENMFDQSLGDPDILTRSGGASWQFSILDDVQINAVLRATKKKERVNLVTAPSVTCFNTQRSNITIRNQVAYIEDFNVEAAQNVTIADPVVGTIEDGLVLDMRPVITADRRYITVEMQPTVALLQRPMDTITTTLGGAGSTPVTIQLPELQIKRIRTTVTVPDGGAFLLGGLREISEIANESGVPILSDIPILGNLIRRQGRSNLRSDLVIVVKARITDLRELANTVPPDLLGD